MVASRIERRDAELQCTCIMNKHLAAGSGILEVLIRRICMCARHSHPHGASRISRVSAFCSPCALLFLFQYYMLLYYKLQMPLKKLTSVRHCLMLCILHNENLLASRKHHSYTRTVLARQPVADTGSTRGLKCNDQSRNCSHSHVDSLRVLLILVNVPDCLLPPS